MDFNSINDIIGGFNKVLKLSSVGGLPPIPTPLILIGVPKRAGLSPIKIASQAGLPVGVLPSGAISPDEIMERIRAEEYIKAFQEEAIITIAIPPGTTLTAAGISPTGPVSVFGSTITLSKGYGVIQ